MFGILRIHRLLALLSMLSLFFVVPAASGEGSPSEPGAALGRDDQVVTIDHEVPHVSTVPANQGELVHLFVRECVRSGDDNGEPRKAVLMIHGASVPALALFDLRVDGKSDDEDDDDRHYSWALQLAKAGFDVFILDHQGSGRSPRPKMDEPLNANPAQQSILVPNPLSATGEPVYKSQLINAKSDWDELDTVVDYIRENREVDKVALVGASQGAFRVGPYAIQHPDKVESVLFFAPIFNINGRASKAGTRFDAPVALPVSSPAAQFGFPMNLTTKAALSNSWSLDLKSEGQREEGIFEIVWSAIMDNDSIGKTWGPILPDGSPVGVMRVRNPFLWGWNSTTVKLDGPNGPAGEPVLGGAVPVLIIYGEHDSQVTAAPFSVTALYETIQGPSKLMFKVAAAGHFMQWERQRRVLHHFSKQWLKHGAVEELTSGSFLVDADGNISEP
jgi:pimeloyl-ACP methyl ester carboxylesterase